MDILSKIDKQSIFFRLKTCQYHDFKHKPDYISLRKQENCIKRQKKRGMPKKISDHGGIFFKNS